MIFTSSLLDISNKSIPKTSTNPKKSKPWYNDECKDAIKQRKQALSKFCRYPTKENLNKVKNFRAKARRTIKASKHKSWKSYVSNLNHKTPIKKVLDMIRKISGKSKSPSFTQLNTKRGTKATSKKEIANTLGETFLDNSSSRNYSEKFQNIKKQEEKIKLNFTSSNAEEYNSLFNITELKDAIAVSKQTATGPDDIHYQMLKHLPETALDTLLHIFNGIWTTGVFPESWRLATIIPIPKPGKDHAEPTNYRPIALTSCLCKTLERMINKRLVWYLESNNLITKSQSGFRAERSTNDNLVRLETFIRDAFIKREHVVAVFFDLEKAYDTTWRYGILKDLHNFGLKGRLPNFIKSFLEDRTIQVRVGSTLSDLYDQEQGVPQGAILSTTLFNVKLNDIINCLDFKTDGSLYVDDFCICFRSKNMRTIERHLQQCLNRIKDWATRNGFKFSKSKTQCVHFCQQRKIHNDPALYIYGSQIPVVAPLLESSNINTKNIQKHSFSDIPFWCITKPTILLDLHNSKKSLSDSHLMKQNFQELQSRLSDYQHIYTDGSKVEEKVACAYISGSHHEKIRLPDGSSIFTAESKAIDMALDYVMNNSLDNNFVIFSDSLSVLKSLNHTSSKSPKIQNLIEKHHELSKTKEIIFCWLPSHVGIKGNEAADVKAKASLDLEIPNFKLPCTDFKPFINRYILSKWQLSWHRATFNKLHEIKPVLGKNNIYRSLRREEVVLTRLRIGHTRLTNSYLLKREDQPFCISCNEPFTVKHFLIDCIEFSHVRRQFFQTNDLRYLFENVSNDSILMFLKHINLFNKV